MVAYLFPDDPFLPGLGTAMDDNAMKRVVGEVLPACREGQVRVLRCRVTALRYRPGRRCTVRAEVSLRATGSRAIASVVLFAKLYHDRDKAAAVFEDSAAVSRSESLRSEGVVVATPIGFVPKLAMVLNESVAGAPLQAWLAGASYGNKDESRVRQGLIGAARGVASLHSSAVESNRHRPPARVAVERMARRSARVAMVDAGLGRRMERLAAALLDLLEGFAQSSSEVTFVHGDCKPSQFLIDGRDIAMLDFDHCGMADPASDVGSFTASIRQQRVRAALAGAKGAATPPAPLVLEKLFVDEYCDRRKADVDFRRRVRWYEASALLRKAYRAFQRSPRSALCPALVDEGWLSLQSLSSGRLERVGASTR
jgi:aminoglycoside phosphotransferase (APT) family kinase protein